MKASSKRALSLLLAAGLIVASLIIYATLILPEYRITAALRGEIVSKTGLLERQKAVITQVQYLIAQYQGVAKLGDTLSLSLPEEESVSSIMAQINAISQSSGVAIQSIGASYLPIRPSSGQQSFIRGSGIVRINLSIVGSYSALKRFLQFLETNVRIMDLRSLTLTLGGKQDQDIYNYSLTFDTYYQAKR